MLAARLTEVYLSYEGAGGYLRPCVAGLDSVVDTHSEKVRVRFAAPEPHNFFTN